MLKPLKKISPLYFLVDVFLIWGTFFTTYILRYTSSLEKVTFETLPYYREHISAFALWFLFIIINFKRRGLYTTDRRLSIPKEIYRVILSITYSSILIGAIIFFAQYKFYSRLVFAENIILLGVCLAGWRVVKRIILRKLIERGFHNTNVLIVGAGRVGHGVLREIRKIPWFGFHVVGFLDDKVQGEVDGVFVLGHLKDFTEVVRRHFVDEVIITVSIERRLVQEIMKKARHLRLAIRFVPEHFEESYSILHMQYLGVMPIFTYKERTRNPEEYAIKRMFDIGVSFFGIILLLPIFLAIAFLIKTTSKGPIFFVQKRVGLKGRIFKFYKFRSMVSNADALKEELNGKNEVRDGIIFKMKEDPRVTSLGRFLRKHSLDELPQLFNVLKGDMSLVGPRPPTIDEVKQYTHEHMQRLSIRPGISGLSQVRGRSELTFRKWVKWDVWYVNNWSFGIDLLILLWTIPAIIKGKGAY